jgi:hypothetical protein
VGCVEQEWQPRCGHTFVAVNFCVVVVVVVICAVIVVVVVVVVVVAVGW